MSNAPYKNDCIYDAWGKTLIGHIDFGYDASDVMLEKLWLSWGYIGT